MFSRKLKFLNINMGILLYWFCSNLCIDKNFILKFMFINLIILLDIREGYVYIIIRKY